MPDRPSLAAAAADCGSLMSSPPPVFVSDQQGVVTSLARISGAEPQRARVCSVVVGGMAVQVASPPARPGAHPVTDSCHAARPSPEVPVTTILSSDKLSYNRHCKDAVHSGRCQAAG